MKKEDVSLQKIKLREGGAKGVELEYSYLEMYKGKGYANNVKMIKGVSPLQSLINSIHGLRVEVAKIENVDYGRRLATFQGADMTPNQMNLMENLVQEAINKIEITGIVIKEKGNSEGVIITYKKEDINGKVTGTATPWVDLENSSYLVEEDILDKLINIKSATLKYMIDQSYEDSEQLAIEVPDYEDVELSEATIDDSLPEHN